MRAMIFIRLILFTAVIVMAQSCATTPYKGLEEKRLNQVMREANESYALGTYARAAVVYGKAVQLAVIQQDHSLLAEAQFKLALSLERSFHPQAAVTAAWLQARFYAEKYHYRPFTVILGWLNWHISLDGIDQPNTIAQQLEQFQRQYSPGNSKEAIQLLNLLAKWHLAAGATDKAQALLDDAQAQIDRSEDDQGLALTLFNKAMIAVLKGSYTLGLELLQRSLALDSREGNISGVYANLGAQAKIYDILGNRGQAAILREQIKNTKDYILGRPI